GIPLASFDPKKWHLQPFGHYTGPIPIFAGNYQPRMAELFRTGNPGPLDFGIGYRSRRDASSLLLAQRATPEVREAAINPSLTTTTDGVAGIPVGSPNAPAWVRQRPRIVETAAKPPSPQPQAPGYRGFFGFFRRP
ncbi:MAG TPA: hypothetical protein VMR17_24830, partial [Xanthobacteraceae bacterium]|nr:hypothetical protein [Xanthobacteraceae bacterium]